MRQAGLIPIPALIRRVTPAARTSLWLKLSKHAVAPIRPWLSEFWGGPIYRGLSVYSQVTGGEYQLQNSLGWRMLDKHLNRELG